MKKVPLSVVQLILGRSSIVIMQQRAHIAPDVMRDYMREALSGTAST